MKTELEFNLRLTWKETTPRRAASPQNKAARPRRRATGSCHGVAEEEERRDTSSAVTTSEVNEISALPALAHLFESQRERGQVQNMPPRKLASTETLAAPRSEKQN